MLDEFALRMKISGKQKELAVLLASLPALKHLERCLCLHLSLLRDLPEHTVNYLNVKGRWRERVRPVWSTFLLNHQRRPYSGLTCAGEDAVKGRGFPS